jgi:hypothetical protein
MTGIPLDLASSLLGAKSIFNRHFLLHIHLHAKARKGFGSKAVNREKYRISLDGLMGLINSLERSVGRLSGSKRTTPWSDYYEDIHYTEAAMKDKCRLVAELIEIVKPVKVWDLGANAGLFGRIATENGIHCVAFDADHDAVEKNYVESRKRNDIYMLPLVMDLTNPTSGFGWSNEERMGLIERGPADLALALALVHHLRITNNVPLSGIARFFSMICTWLIIEFVPKTDPKVQLLLRNREDVFSDYSVETFESSFSEYFKAVRCQRLSDSERSLYLFHRIEQ